MQSDILFDNIYIGHSPEDAASLRSSTYDIKRPIEDEAESASKPKPDSKPSSPNDLVFMDDPVKYVKEKGELFFTLLKRDPVQAVQFMPEFAGAIGGGLVLVIALVAFAASSGAPAAPSAAEIKAKAKKAADVVVEKKDQAVEAAASGVDATKAEVNKRTTRSSDKP